MVRGVEIDPVKNENDDYVVITSGNEVQSPGAIEPSQIAGQEAYQLLGSARVEHNESIDEVTSVVQNPNQTKRNITAYAGAFFAVTVAVSGALYAYASMQNK